MSNPVLFLLMLLAFFINLWIGLFAHEMGHFLCCKLVKIPVMSVTVGRGPLLLRWRANHVPFELRLFPFDGFVSIFPILLPARYKEILVFIGDGLANITLIILLELLWGSGFLSHLRPILIASMFYGQIIPLFVLLPLQVTVKGKKIESDGLKVVKALLRKRQDITRAGAIYFNMVRRYFPEAGHEQPHRPYAWPIFIEIY